MTSAAENHYAERMRLLLDVPVTRLSVCLFGASYTGQLRAAARSALAA